MRDYHRLGPGIQEWTPGSQYPSWDDLPVWMRRREKETQDDPDTCPCGCEETVTVEIHIGQRLDCAKCGKFRRFAKWRGTE